MTGGSVWRKGPEMTSDDDSRAWLGPAATWLAIASIVLVLVNAALVLRNQGDQGTVNQRQQIINQAAQLSRASQILIETIARTAIANKDDTLTALLERHGIKVNPGPAPAAASAPEKTP
jgi:hypothetical protein